MPVLGHPCHRPTPERKTLGLDALQTELGTLHGNESGGIVMERTVTMFGGTVEGKRDKERMRVAEHWVSAKRTVSHKGKV